MLTASPGLAASVLLAGRTNQAPEWGKAAPLGLFVLLAFVVVCFFLFRSMNRRIRKVPSSFDTTDSSTQDQDLTQQPIGQASAGLPTVEFRDPAQQSRPRLGTPDDLEAELEAKKRARIEAAKKRRPPRK